MKFQKHLVLTGYCKFNTQNKLFKLYKGEHAE